MDELHKDLDIELNFDDLQTPSEEARRRIKDAEMEELQSRYVQEVSMYMLEGNMPRRVWDKLPRLLKAQYKEKFKGQSGHIKGIPMTQAQRDAADRRQALRRSKAKAAKKARKVSRK